jgi:hypothetical protein
MLDKIKHHLIEIFACMFLILFIDWSVGYYANALFNTKFDLQSCWGGVAALGGSGTLAAIKYIYDSKYNSEENKPL